jgi:peptidoglycan/LPS O-acetylase OafA/YrhL
MDDLGRSSNNLGFLRLLFAVLVILSHSPELVDGNRSREILTSIFGTLSFGELGVDGFFLISGYLITKSLLESRSKKDYLVKRILRIYPGYIVAYLLCLFALGPFVGGQIAGLSGLRTVVHIIGLKPPEMPGVFVGTPYPVLNGSMWTISYEFRCYLLIMGIAMVGQWSKRLLVAIGAFGLLLFLAIICGAWPAATYPSQLSALTGEPDVMARFAGVFLCGALHYLCRGRITYSWPLAACAAIGLIVSMFSPHLAEMALALFGGYVLFWFAFKIRSKFLSEIGRTVDLSYGIYLYAWPVQKLLIWHDPAISPWLVFLESTVIAGMLAVASWYLVEKPFLGLKSWVIVSPKAAAH